jgi:hypothetical protein
MIVTIFIKFPQDIDTLAETIRELFNLPLANRSPGRRDQRRDSINYGGVKCWRWSCTSSTTQMPCWRHSLATTRIT